MPVEKPTPLLMRRIDLTPTRGLLFPLPVGKPPQFQLKSIIYVHLTEAFQKLVTHKNSKTTILEIINAPSSDQSSAAFQSSI